MTRGEERRRELAAVLQYDVAVLHDDARLRDDLGLDSLAMMTLLTWLETHGVVLDAQAGQPASVADVLGLLDRAVPGVSIRLTGSDATVHRATDFTIADQSSTGQSSTGQSSSGQSSSGQSGFGPLAPVLANHELRLSTVEPEDVRFLYTLAAHPDTCYRWRYRGAPPPIDRFMADLWAQVLIQFVARRNGDGEPVGHVVAYGADLGQGYAYVGAVFRPPYAGTGLAAQGVAMFVRYLFHTFVLRKLYVEIPGFNWPQMRSGEGRLFQVEGVMRDHEHYAGRYWDRYLCAIYPEALAVT